MVMTACFDKTISSLTTSVAGYRTSCKKILFKLKAVALARRKSNLEADKMQRSHVSFIIFAGFSQKRGDRQTAKSCLRPRALTRWGAVAGHSHGSLTFPG